MNASKLQHLDPEIISRYRNGESSKDLAKAYGTCPSAIDYRLKINGIEKRTISGALSLKTKSEAHRKALSLSRIQSGIAKGSKNPNWKGGVQDTWSELKNSSAYKQWRTSVFQRDSYTCRMCGYDKGGIIQAHHIHRRVDNPELCFEVENGVTLCAPCHIKTMFRESKFIAFFEKTPNSVNPKAQAKVTPS